MKPKLLLVADTFHPKVAYKQFEISLLVPKSEEKIHKLRYIKKIYYAQTYKRIAMSGYPSVKVTHANLKKIKHAIQEADIVFVQGPALLSFLSMYYGHKFKKHVISYVHVLSWELVEKFIRLPKTFHRFTKKTALKLYNYCDEILIPYHDLKDDLLKEGVKAKMTVARLGVDIDRFHPTKDKTASKKKAKIKPEKHVIGYVGRISKEKNVHVIREAFHKLHHQHDLHLLMVGDGPQEQIRPFKKLKNCTVTGFVNNVQDYLKAMDVFIMPSLTETTSLATLEAMSTGLAVVVSKVGFVKHYVVKNYNGVFFARNSASMLATKLENLIQNPEQRLKLGQNARKTIAYSFSWERSINKITRILLHYSPE